MTTSLFTNYTEEEFTGYWDGKPRSFKPGESQYMPDYLAKHFAKHLTNRELLRKDSNGDFIHKNGDKFVSPKKPEEVPMFMELFGRAYQTNEDSVDNDPLDTEIEVLNKNREKVIEVTSEIEEPKKVKETKDSPDDESSFGGKVKETKTKK